MRAQVAQLEIFQALHPQQDGQLPTVVQIMSLVVDSSAIVVQQSIGIAVVKRHVDVQVPDYQ
jgi:hypothetical protein